MKVATSAEMREIDRITIEDIGIPSPVLMERAGTAVAEKVAEIITGRKVLVLCGRGNNGGDGLVAARHLHNRGFQVKVVMLAKPDSLSQDCKAQYQIVTNGGLRVEVKQLLSGADLHGALVVDAVFGTGLSRGISGPTAELFRSVNESGVPVVSVDMPSGISSDTGEILGDAIRASHTVTFGLPKRGHFLFPGAEYSGILHVADIGFQPGLLKSDLVRAQLINKGYALSVLPERPRNSYKGDYGHVLIIAGSRGKTGAAIMTAKSCMRAGAGLVTIGVPETLIDIFQTRVTEEMTLPLPDNGNGTLNCAAVDHILDFAVQQADIIAIGPGIGVSSDTEAIVKRLVEVSTIPLVIDADGLNAINDGGAILKNAKSPIIITPHPGEMARLMRKSGFGILEVEKDRMGTAQSFANDKGVTVVLKGVPTIVAAPDGDLLINTTGNPGMATAGAGDVLTGIIASLVGQGLSSLHSSAVGVYLHGLAGDRAASETGLHSLIASDIIAYLPAAFRCLV
ncbi:MAG TPA: NAD(P)H-hydrate dehydratase [Dissulfurispiraceae bacterium]|nr:NAD(P)H-hydrate dehydratase [Dissulfurispiraceae bacterium]